jgi:hypothetical protein
MARYGVYGVYIYPKESILHIEHGESLKSRSFSSFISRTRITSVLKYVYMNFKKKKKEN